MCTVHVFILHQLDISNGGWWYQGCCSSLLFYVVSVFLGIKLSVNKYASNYLRFRLFGSFLSCYSHFLESLTHVIQISFFTKNMLTLVIKLLFKHQFFIASLFSVIYLIAKNSQTSKLTEIYQSSYVCNKDIYLWQEYQIDILPCVIRVVGEEIYQAC